VAGASRTERWGAGDMGKMSNAECRMSNPESRSAGVALPRRRDAFGNTATERGGYSPKRARWLQPKESAVATAQRER
jgi:hypothetical protein